MGIWKAAAEKEGMQTKERHLALLLCQWAMGTGHWALGTALSGGKWKGQGRHRGLECKTLNKNAVGH
jgi:hypothetical protein